MGAPSITSMIMLSEWTRDELEYFESLPESELELWLLDLPMEEQENLVTRLVEHTAQIEEGDKEVYVPNKATLAARVGMSLTMLDRYIAKGAKITGPPYGVLTAQAEIDRIKAESGVDRDTVSVDLRRERLRAEIAEKIQSGRAKELKNDILAGKSYPADDVDQYLAEYATRIKTRLEQMPTEAAMVVPAEWRDAVRTALESVVFELLTELAGKTFETNSETDDDDGDVIAKT